ncbi:MAG TPA: hypothetical protein VF881_11125, partial [Polyangiaceae bacterium]
MGGLYLDCLEKALERTVALLLQSWHGRSRSADLAPTNTNYGEAVGITPICETSRDALASLAPQNREIRLFGQFNITAAVLASADHDLQIWLRPNANYGEAVGITPIDETSRDALASLAPQ